MKYFIIALCLIATTAHAQLVKNLTVGGDAFDGNFRSIGFTAKGDIKKITPNYDWAANAAYRWSKQSKYGLQELIQYENEIYFTSSLSKNLGNWKVLAFTDDERSYMRGIDLRSSLGVGVGHYLIKSDKLDISLTEVALPEYYWSDVSSNYNNFTVRASTRLKVDYEKAPLKLSSVSLFQPAVLSTREVSFKENLTWRSANSIEFSVSKRVSIGMLYNVSYEGYPYHINKAVKPLQQTASMIFKYKF